MNSQDIEELKREGARKAIKDKIHSLSWEIKRESEKMVQNGMVGLIPSIELIIEHVRDIKDLHEHL